MSKKKGFGIGEIIGIFLVSIVALALTPTIVDSVATATSGMSAGATKSLLNLFPLLWVILISSIPVGSISIYLVARVKSGTMSIGDLIAVFLPSVVGLALTPTVTATVTNTTVNMSAGATKTMLNLFPMFWVIYLIGIPVGAISVFFYVRSR